MKNIGRVTEEMRVKWDERIRILLTREKDLTDWELGFIESLQTRRNYDKDLTFNQSSKLNEIFNMIGG